MRANSIRLVCRQNDGIGCRRRLSGHVVRGEENAKREENSRREENARREEDARRPVSRVLSARSRGSTRDDHSSGTRFAARLTRPTRTAGRERPRALPVKAGAAAPIRSCSRWGLPCRRRYRRRGALLPHRFTLTAAIRYAPRRSVLCGTVPGFTSAGCYPAPLVHGARTFLPGNLSVSPERPSDRLTGTGMGMLAAAVKPGRKTG